MPDRTTGTGRRMRIAFIAVLIALSVGLITYSCLAVSYPVGQERLSELTVTYLSLSHSVEREQDGRLTSADYPEAEPQPKSAPTVASPAPVKPAPAPAVNKPAQPAEELAAKKAPAKKKPSAKKPPKKQPPKKKPPAKEPDKGKKPCPT